MQVNKLNISIFKCGHAFVWKRKITTYVPVI
jgi:hypothetical protein